MSIRSFLKFVFNESLFFKKDNSRRNVWRLSDGRNRCVMYGCTVVCYVSGRETHWVLLTHGVVAEVVIHWAECYTDGFSQS